MNEDEAFIRAIVDSPGDDTPRLVYADWLDDRDDPRGPYLRAEREAVVTGDIARLRELAVELDPVWVARVSLPPVGICLEHVELRWRGSFVTDSDVAEVEQQHEVSFPPDYRAFLLNYNGALAADPTADEDARNSIYNWTLYPLRELPRGDCHNMIGSIVRSLSERHNYVSEQQAPQAVADWYLQSVPVGHNPDYDSGILLALSGTEKGGVCVLHYLGGLEHGHQMMMEHGRRTTSFADFLAELPHHRMFRD